MTQDEEWVEEFWKMLGNNAFVKSTNSITGKVEEYPEAILDMEATVAIHGEFDKYAIDLWLRDTIRKVREEERAAIVGVLKKMIKKNITSPEDCMDKPVLGYSLALEDAIAAITK